MTIGKPGGCKSTANAKILYELQRLGKIPEIVSDRILLENAVVQDVQTSGIKREDGAMEGAHSILFDGNQPPGRKVFEVRDGLLLNEVHDYMVEIAGSHQSPSGLLLEYATGPDVNFPDVPLLQSGTSLIERFYRLPASKDHHIHVVEIDASLDERLRRNGRRIDGMREETFLKYFPDGGELREKGNNLVQMGVAFTRIDNDHDDLARFLRDIENFSAEHIRPLFEGNGPRPEAKF